MLRLVFIGYNVLNSPKRWYCIWQVSVQKFIRHGARVNEVLDTGASLLIISQATFNRLQQHDATLTLHPSATQLLTYTGKPIPVVGVTNMTVQLSEIVATLSAQMVVGEGPDLMGA